MLKFCSVRGQWTYVQRVEITQNIYGYNLRDLDYFKSVINFVFLTKCSFEFSETVRVPSEWMREEIHRPIKPQETREESFRTNDAAVQLVIDIG